MNETFERKYFAASNSAQGFVNYYPSVFSRERCKRLYVIKGGPGTGKSRFLREVATYAERGGEQVTYYYCSSDPTSLDGVFLEGSAIGLLDGTAPHAYEPTSVGVFEQIVNLGQFWSEKELIKHRGEVEALANQKQKAFASAYSYLRAMGAVDSAVRDQLYGAVDMHKLTQKAERFVSFCQKEKQPRTEIALCGSIGMQGSVRFDTYERLVERVLRVSNYASLGQMYLGEVLRACRTHGVSVRYSPDPVFPDRIDAIELPENGISLVLAHDGEDFDVNARRFLNEERFPAVRKQIRAAAGHKKELLGAVVEAFEGVKESHFVLEGIFGAAMDFSAKEEFTTGFCRMLLG